jgi:ATP-dependent Lhr-like helicase
MGPRAVAAPAPPAPPTALAGFHAPVQAWFGASFDGPTPVQAAGWPAIQAGESALLLAPTGSGKTLAAFLAVIDRLMFEPLPEAAARCRVVYVSPLKALAVDVDRNLRAPLVGIARQAERLGQAWHVPEIALRTGDTPARERARFARRPADILITTPESLYLILTSRAREALRATRWVIVDEVHALVGGKRGAHLALSLERLEALAGRRLQRIGLSATQRPVEEATRFLGGFAADGATPRPVTVVDAGRVKPLALTVEVPVEDMARLAPPPASGGEPGAGGTAPTSIWPAIYPLLLALIRRHRSTLVFVNSRRLAERLASALNELAGTVIVHAHHGSVAREQRQAIEERLKAGQLPALVATSSLELGIDMGAIDLVVQVEAPPGVASGLQRIGRAGHTLEAPSTGVILPKYRGDLLACAALTERMRAGAVEPVRYPRLPLDVLAQQIVAMVAVEPWRVDDLERLLRGAAPFADLTRALLESVLDMLAGRYPSDDFAELRPRLHWDRLQGTLEARAGARRVALENGGTIPDRGLYGVFLAGAPPGHGRVGELDEEMVFESRVGETFLLGASTWRIEDITHDRVVVTPAPGQPGRMPFWHGDAGGRPVEFGRAIGALARTLRALPEPAAIARLVTAHDLTETAARNLVRYLADQAAAGVVPDDRTLVVERFRDELGDWRLCLLSPFGSRVHGPWAMAIGARARRRHGLELDLLWSDDGIVARFPDLKTPPDVEELLPDPDEVEALVIEQLGTGGGARAAGQGAPASALFASRFREAAARALLLPRRFPGQRIPLWQQRKRAADLLHATIAAERGGRFPIVLETYRECLRDVFDIPELQALLRDVRTRAVRIASVDTTTPSPFAAALLFNYVANFLYEGDAPLAERRAQALLVDPAQLRELLGQVELRELLDADAVTDLGHELQRLAAERRARHADAVHDLLRGLGDLSTDEVRARAAPELDASAALDGLARQRRIVALRVAGEPRWVAVEDVARYRDALGVPPPPGLPAAFLEPAADPVGDLVARYARTHGPFSADDVARRLGLPPGVVAEALAALERRGRAVAGELLPGGHGREWCDAGVLRTLRQRSLARLRRAVEPVEAPALGRLYLDWQGVTAPRRGAPALAAVVAELGGAAIPASVLEHDVLPARLADYDPRWLDALTASGAVVWLGVEPLAPRDGRVRLLPVEQAALFVRPATAPPEDGALPTRIRAVLGARGALFFPQLLAALGGGFVPDVIEALWELVWAGEVTNDTLEPLRAYTGPRRRPADGRAARLTRTRRVLGPGPAGMPAEVSGRWSLVRSLVLGEPTATERLAARTRALLDRLGVVTRAAVLAEGLDGGFAPAYGVLRAMEEAGRVRRGYFVAGQGGTQFALPAAVDRLRALREMSRPAGLAPEPQGLVLAATDPASPYGAALPWPARPDGRRPARAAGAYVVLVDGALAAWLSPRERQVLTVAPPESGPAPEAVVGAAAAALARAVTAGPWRHLFVREVDGQPAEVTPLGAALRAAGFQATAHGLGRRR